MTRQIVGAFRQVIGFLVQGIEVDGWRAFEAEVKELIAPHMAVLVYRRTKLLDGATRESWSDELETFMRQNLWPLLGDSREYADRNRTFVTLMLDVAIAEEARRAVEPRYDALPFARSFDASWAS